MAPMLHSYQAHCLYCKLPFNSQNNKVHGNEDDVAIELKD